MVTKVNLFHEQMEPNLAEGYLRRLKSWLMVGGISLAGLIVFLIGIGVYHAIWGLPEEENGNDVIFWIGASFLFVFTISTIGSWVIFLKGRQKTTRINTQ